MRRFGQSGARTNASGVKKIKRANYNTNNGLSQKNFWWELSAAVRKRDNNQCVPCRLRNKYVQAKDVHHIIPLSKGGTNTMSNLICLCEDCHNLRHNHLYKARKR